jgi:hypothetical protein
MGENKTHTISQQIDESRYVKNRLIPDNNIIGFDIILEFDTIKNLSKVIFFKVNEPTDRLRSPYGHTGVLSYQDSKIC